jgi:hypothetical protein
LKLTADLTKKIADHVKHGIPERAAAVANGVDREEFAAWIAKGEADRAAGRDNLHVKLVRAIEKAIAEFEVTNQQLLMRHAAGFRRQDGDHEEGDLRATKIALEELDRRRADEELERVRKLTTY